MEEFSGSVLLPGKKRAQCVELETKKYEFLNDEISRVSYWFCCGKFVQHLFTLLSGGVSNEILELSLSLAGFVL